MERNDLVSKGPNLTGPEWLRRIKSSDALITDVFIIGMTECTRKEKYGDIKSKPFYGMSTSTYPRSIYDSILYSRRNVGVCGTLKAVHKVLAGRIFGGSNGYLL